MVSDDRLGLIERAGGPRRRSGLRIRPAKGWGEKMDVMPTLAQSQERNRPLSLVFDISPSLKNHLIKLSWDAERFGGVLNPPVDSPRAVCARAAGRQVLRCSCGGGERAAGRARCRRGWAVEHAAKRNSRTGRSELGRSCRTCPQRNSRTGRSERPSCQLLPAERRTGDQAWKLSNMPPARTAGPGGPSGRAVEHAAEWNI